MTPNIETEGIWQLVKDWPKEAWPPLFAIGNPGCNVEGFAEFAHDACTPELAYHAFVGAGLVWLGQQDLDPSLSKIASGWSVYCHITDCDYPGPHPLAAVSASVLAAKEGA